MPYGDKLAERLQATNASVIVTCIPPKSVIAATEILSDHPNRGRSKSIPREDAFLVGLQLRDYPRREYWEDGKPAPICDLRAGESCFHDLKRDPVVLLDKPFHSVNFYLPRATFNAISDDVDAPPIGDLQYKPGTGVADSTIANLGRSLLNAFGLPDHADRLFVDHVTLAIGTHVAQTYGGLRPIARPVRGGLALWQVRRAKELLSANLDGAIMLEEIAQECRLSVSHFSRAFHQSVGVAPHRWLLSFRVDSAKDLLRQREMTLSDVALACGFADQSHFTRVFTRMTGISPGAWRRGLDQGEVSRTDPLVDAPNEPRVFARRCHNAATMNDSKQLH
jgi:AraC family transcriptional regulator